MVNSLIATIRILGASLPLAASVNELINHVGAAEVEARLKRLEDPISSLHPDVPNAAKAIYAGATASKTTSISLESGAYGRLSRALAVLEAQGLIKGEHALGKKFHGGLRVLDPTFMLYACALSVPSEQLQKLVDMVESCGNGQSLRAQAVMSETGFPNAVVVAVFKAFEAKGYGTCSRELGVDQHYMGKT